MKPTLLVLAAGMGSRYGGLKQADQVGPNGETIIDYSIYDAIRAGFGKVVLVVRQNILDEMKGLFDPKWGDKINLEYAIQEVNVPIEGISNLPERTKPWGTGHAVMVAKHLIDEPFAVINADDFYGADAFKTMSEFLQDAVSDNENAMVGYILKNTLSDHGYVSRGICETDVNNYLITVTERTNIERINGEVAFTEKDGSQHSLDENSYVSMNFWGFHQQIFEEIHQQFVDFVKENRGNSKAEFYIPTVVNQLIKTGKIRLSVLPNKEKWYGVTYREDRAMVEKAFGVLVEEGRYPGRLWG